MALMGGGTVPQRFTLRDALVCFLDFRFETIRRRSAFQLRKVESRAHIVDGLLMALACVDDVIDIVRNAPDLAGAREVLTNGQHPQLELSREQADAVLKLQLGQLTRLNKGKLEDERDTLVKDQKKLQKLLTVDKAVRDSMRKEFEYMKKKFGIERRSVIQYDDAELSDLDLVRNSRSVIVVTRGGYIKRMPLKVFESQKRGTRGKKGTVSDGSSDTKVAQCFTCNDHDTLLMVTQKGISFGLRAYQIPSGGRTAKGTPLPSVLPISGDDQITAILPVSEFTDDNFIVLTTENGWIKKTALKAFEKITSRGLTIAKLDDGDQLLWAKLCSDEDDILVATKNGMATRFDAACLRPTGRTSRGVKSIKLKEGDSVADMNVISSKGVSREGEYMLAVTSEGYGKRVPSDEFRTVGRGGVGVIAIKFKNVMEKDTVKCLRIVTEDDEILVITSKGIMVRQKVKDIPSQSRQATGVKVQKLDNGDRISEVSIVPTYEETDE